ncbi:MAG: hypothetical protein J0H74_05425 [Chitinophagaceae bacterium]|nr:hypothetical protein [Chitinophagaceae bacterium]
MSGFRLKLNRLRNIPYASSIQEALPFDSSFEVEYFFNGRCNWVAVKPILIGTVVVFLVNFLESYDEPMALVYNKKDIWSDIEKESTGLTEAIGAAIEQYYSTRYLPWSNSQIDGGPDGIWDNHLLN